MDEPSSPKSTLCVAWLFKVNQYSPYVRLKLYWEKTECIYGEGLIYLSSPLGPSLCGTF
jgi:hypothetical protein